MMPDVVVQGTQLLVLIQRVIQFVRYRHRADPKQHPGQKPDQEARFSF